MLKLECSANCGNADQYAGFTDTEQGVVCNLCGNIALVTENDELEKRYPRWYLEAEFILKN